MPQTDNYPLIAVLSEPTVAVYKVERRALVKTLYSLCIRSPPNYILLPPPPTIIRLLQKQMANDDLSAYFPRSGHIWCVWSLCSVRRAWRRMVSGWSSPFYRWFPAPVITHFPCSHLVRCTFKFKLPSAFSALPSHVVIICLFSFWIWLFQCNKWCKWSWLPVAYPSDRPAH